jgi:hypothetical protein
VTRTSRLLAVLAAATAVAGCGGDDVGDPIPQAKRDQLLGELDQVESAFDERACEEVGPAVTALQTTIARLDEDGVGDDVQTALSDGADHLREIATGGCEPEQEEVETTPTDPQETVTLPTPPPQTTPDQTIPEPDPETETETVPPEEEEEEEPDEDGDKGQFDPTDDGGTGAPGQLKKGKGD